jgi:hypothetical protein
MISATYRVVTRGLQPGYTAAMVTDLVVSFFNCSREQAVAMTSSEPVTVKRRLTPDAAHKYVQALARCGCAAAVEEEPAPALHAGSDGPALTLSRERLQRLEPRLLDTAGWVGEADRLSWIDSIRQTLAQGDCRAAVVVDAAHSVVASYTGELDCAVLLQFDEAFGLVHGWQNGTRLLSVNAYFGRDKGVAKDLQPGPQDTGRSGNVWPLVADLLTDDHERLRERKRMIVEDEWNRAGQLGRRLLAEEAAPRDGRPLGSRRPAAHVTAVPELGPTQDNTGRRGGATGLSFLWKALKLPGQS